MAQASTETSMRPACLHLVSVKMVWIHFHTFYLFVYSSFPTCYSPNFYTQIVFWLCACSQTFYGYYWMTCHQKWDALRSSTNPLWCPVLHCPHTQSSLCWGCSVLLCLLQQWPVSALEMIKPSSLLLHLRCSSSSSSHPEVSFPRGPWFLPSGSPLWGGETFLPETLHLPSSELFSVCLVIAGSSYLWFKVVNRANNGKQL